MKGVLPEKLLSDLIELTDTITASADPKLRLNRNDTLVGEIIDEWDIGLPLLKNIKFESFLFDMIREYIQVVKFQRTPKDTHLSCSEEVFVNSHAFFKEDSWEILSSWFNNQVDDEYNPIHFHQGVLSGVLYLKIPEYLPARKNDYQDGSIYFVGNQGFSDGLFTAANFAVSPKVGDIFLFPSTMRHTVYPFRTKDGKGIRRSMSFNVNDNIMVI